MTAIPARACAGEHFGGHRRRQVCRRGCRPLRKWLQDKGLEGRAENVATSRRTKPVAKTHRQCEIRRSNQGKPASS